MEKSFGWMGQILRVNLSTGSITKEPTANYTTEVLGGRGFGQLILFRELEPSVDPLGPDNKIILSAGPLVGTMAPASARLSVDCKNPVTGGVGSANMGGHFAPELKFAGFDSVIIEGCSSEPVYLFIRDGGAEIRNASALWGQTVTKTEITLREELGDNRLRVVSIGPAGENLVKGACLITERGRTAGHSGTGAVFGSKKLKAVAVRGTGSIQVYDPDGFLKEVKRCLAKVEASIITKNLRARGTTQGEEGPSGGWNNQNKTWLQEKADRVKRSVSHNSYEDFEVRVFSCFNCPSYCQREYVVKEGPWAGTDTEGAELTIPGFGPTLDIDDPATLVKLHSVCQELGVDNTYADVALGWAFECWQHGLITSKDTGGLNLIWGNREAAVKLLEDIAYRRGFGAILADGVKKAVEVIGRGSEEWARITPKGAVVTEDIRGHGLTYGLGVTLANRGDGHLEGARYTFGSKEITPEKSKELFGVADVGPPNDPEHKVKVVVWTIKLMGLLNSLGICEFMTQKEYMDGLSIEDITPLFSKATGIEKSADELSRIVLRQHNIEKAFNTLHAGFTRKDDAPPKRFMTMPIKSGRYAGDVMSREKLDKLLNDYYELMGWDLASGKQTKAGLLELGLDEVAEKLERHGKLQG